MWQWGWGLRAYPDWQLEFIHHLTGDGTAEISSLQRGKITRGLGLEPAAGVNPLLSQQGPLFKQPDNVWWAHKSGSDQGDPQFLRQSGGSRVLVGVKHQGQGISELFSVLVQVCQHFRRARPEINYHQSEPILLNGQRQIGGRSGFSNLEGG